MALTDNLVAFWELEEASGTRADATGRGNNLVKGSVTDPSVMTGRVGNAVQLVAAQTLYLTITDNADVSMGDIDFTIACWVYLDALGTMTIVSKFGDTANVNREFYLQYESTLFNAFNFWVGGPTTQGNIPATTFGTPGTSAWHLVIAWHDSVNNQLGICVDAGTADTTAYSDGSVNGNWPFEVGYGTYIGAAFDGRIDQLGVWKRVLTSDERTTLYSGGAGLSYAAMTGGGGGLSVALDETWHGEGRSAVGP